jgi:hypothetical protein
MTSIALPLIRGLLAALLIFLSAKGFADASHTTSDKCASGLTHSFEDVRLSAETMPAGVLSAAAEIGIEKSPPFKSYEQVRLGELVSPRAAGTVDIHLAEAQPSDLFDLQDPKGHGVVAAPISDRDVIKDRAQEIFVSLPSPLGEVSYDSGGIKEADPALKNQLAIKAFLNRLSAATGMKEEQMDLVRVVLEKMVQSAYLADHRQGHPTLTEIYMRWKKDGKGKDVDLAHTDPEAYSVSTLALVGLGTEHFIGEGHQLQIRTTPSGLIVHMLGDLSGRPVLHRSSTKRGPRLVFVLFWH